MNVLVGLGNPGPQYALNRHNIGFTVVDAVANFFEFPPFKASKSVLVTEKTIEKNRFFLCKPISFMNRSGSALAPLLNFFKIPLKDVWVVHDDLDLEPFRIKLKRGGGDGGHNGLENLDCHIGKDYGRLRIGIGRPVYKTQVSEYVLSNFPNSERQALETLLACVVPEIPLLFHEEATVWLNRIFNKK